MNNKLLNEITVLILVIFLFLGSFGGQAKLFGQEINLDKQKARAKLSQVKIASLYENITEVKAFGRNLEDAVNQFKETGTEFIFRGFWLWSPAFETPEDIPFEILKLAETKNLDSAQIVKFIKERGYFYKCLSDSVTGIKKEIPGIIFCGAIPGQKVNSIDYNPVTGKILTREEAWRMSLDPQKWRINFRGKPLTKEGFQKLFGLTHLWIKKFQAYDWSKAPAYFPDITNPDYQELLLSWAKKQIDCGADAIWIDMQFSQASMLARITKDVNHPAVKESYEAAAKIVDRIHAYGLEKGRYIYVGSWSMVSWFPYPAPDFDFVTISPLPQEIQKLKLDEKEWEKRCSRIKQKLGDIPVLVFIDWASSSKTQLGVFSQYLNKKKQNEFLRIADDFFTKKGYIFVYPVHGGWMGQDAKVLSYGQFKVYDSLAPEFDTYETIKELSLIKAGEHLNKSTNNKDEIAPYGQ